MWTARIPGLSYPTARSTSRAPTRAACLIAFPCPLSGRSAPRRRAFVTPRLLPGHSFASSTCRCFHPFAPLRSLYLRQRGPPGLHRHPILRGAPIYSRASSWRFLSQAPSLLSRLARGPDNRTQPISLWKWEVRKKRGKL